MKLKREINVMETNKDMGKQTKEIIIKEAAKKIRSDEQSLVEKDVVNDELKEWRSGKIKEKTSFKKILRTTATGTEQAGQKKL